MSFDVSAFYGLSIIAVLGFGLILGSFATALIYRIPRGLPWVFKGKIEGHNGLRSACTQCRTALKPFDLIPLFSWLFAKGCCRHCKAPVSFLYPMTEITVMIAVFGVYAVYGASFYTLFAMFLIPFLAALFVIDLKHMILPNPLVLTSFLLGLMAFGTHFLDIGLETAQIHILAISHLGGVAVYAGIAWFMGVIMTYILKKPALGFGDVKFFAVAGLWLGLPVIASFLILSGVFGVFLAIVMRKTDEKACFPFGPALILSLYVLLIINGIDLSIKF